MEKLDFSGISTTALAMNVKNHSKGDEYDTFCKCIPCDERCPYYNYLGFSNSLCRENCNKIRLGFKEELKRREGMNKMPEIKVGMFLESNNGVHTIVLPEGTQGIGMFDSKGMNLKNTRSVVLSETKNIYEKKDDENYYSFFSMEFDPKNFKLIWSRQSPNEKKILELKSKAKDLLKKIEELEDE